MTLKKLGAAAVIVNDHHEVLLVKHNYGHFNWEIPGGHAEADESIVATAIREAHEETGLNIRALALTGMYFDAAADMHHCVFRCEIIDTSVTLQPDMAEIVACRFWPLSALPRPMSTFTIQRIEDALRGEPQPLPIVLPRTTWLE